MYLSLFLSLLGHLSLSLSLSLFSLDMGHPAIDESCQMVGLDHGYDVISTRCPEMGRWWRSKFGSNATLDLHQHDHATCHAVLKKNFQG